MANDIVNLARVPQTGLILELKLSQGRNHVARAMSAKRAVYANGSGVVSRVVEMPQGSPVFAVSEKVNCLVMAVAGDPVTFTGITQDALGQTRQFTMVVSKLLVLDQPLTQGFTVLSSGESQLDLNYQN